MYIYVVVVLCGAAASQLWLIDIIENELVHKLPRMTGSQ